MDNHVGNFVLDNGVSAAGTHTQVKFEGDQVVKVRTYDAEPIVEACKAERIATAGEKWGELRKVGTMPMAVYSDYLKIKDPDERKTFIRNWLLSNPAFITFDKYAL